MQALSDFLQIARTETLTVSTGEILSLLAIVSLSMLIRGSKVGILITYIFSLHLTFNVLSNHFNEGSLIAFGVLGGIVMLLGFVSILTE